MKLALGTVQFGLDYGISNNGGRTPFSEVVKIIDTCEKNKISFVDTATQYGSSEEVLGKVLEGRKFNIITKVSGSTMLESELSLHLALDGSLRRLKRERLYGLLFHDADVLTSKLGEGLFRQAEELKRNGVVKKVGVSVYHAEQIESILQHFDIDIIQLPLSVFDQRLLVGGQLSELKKRGVEVHVRSVFLQGILLMSPQDVHPYFSEIHPQLKFWHNELEENRISPAAAALGFVKRLPMVDKIVVGVNDNSQLMELIKAYNEEQSLDCAGFALNDEKYLDPRLWKL